MKLLTCAAARRRLHAFYDEELSVAEQIGVQGHLDACEACAATLQELRLVGSALRLGVLERDWLSYEEAGALTSAVLGRRQAEDDASLFARLQEMFDDMHLVYAGVGAAVATAVCLVIMLSMLRFASFGRPDAVLTTDERPDSLAAILDVLATPGSNADAMAIDGASHARWTARFQAATESAEEDAVFALAAMITRDGRLANVHRLRSSFHQATRDEATRIDVLSDAVTRARIEPGSIGTTQTSASSMVLLVTRTTVHATRNLGVDLQLPPAAPDKKKRAIARMTDPIGVAKA